MSDVTIRIDNHKTMNALLGIAERDIPFAVAKGLTKTAIGARDFMKEDITEIFDHTNAFTRNATGIKIATKHNQTAEIFIKENQSKYLRFEEMGGTRYPKDGTLNSNAKALVISSKDAPKNASGSLPKNYVKTLAQKARQAANHSNRRNKSNITIVKVSGKKSNRTGGFFVRNKAQKTFKRLISFTPRATYKPKFGFVVKVTDYVNKNVNQNIEKSLQTTLKEK